MTPPTPAPTTPRRSTPATLTVTMSSSGDLSLLVLNHSGLWTTSARQPTSSQWTLKSTEDTFLSITVRVVGIWNKSKIIHKVPLQLSWSTATSARPACRPAWGRRSRCWRAPPPSARGPTPSSSCSTSLSGSRRPLLTGLVSWTLSTTLDPTWDCGLGWDCTKYWRVWSWLYWLVDSLKVFFRNRFNKLNRSLTLSIEGRDSL